MLIRGLYDTDGHSYYHYDEKRNRHICEITYSSSSKELIKMVRRVLLNFGIISTLRIKLKAGKTTICGKECNNKEAYCLDIHDYENILKFNKLIGFGIKRKQENINKYLQNKELKNSNNYNLIPI